MKQVKVSLSFFTIIFLLALFFIVVGPFVQIWAVNTLFKTSIQYSWLNWFCVMILNSSIGASSYKSKQ
jgi:hypothetical protein